MRTLWLVLLAAATVAAQQTNLPKIEEWKGKTILVFTPHPDDDTFGAGGARLTSNLFVLDGTDMNDSQNFTPGGAGGQLLGIESILEFQVITHNASAQYGRSMGGIINAVSKSGANAIHGDALSSCGIRRSTPRISLTTRHRLFRGLCATSSGPRWAGPYDTTVCSISATSKASASVWASPRALWCPMRLPGRAGSRESQIPFR